MKKHILILTVALLALAGSQSAHAQAALRVDSSGNVIMPDGVTSIKGLVLGGTTTISGIIANTGTSTGATLVSPTIITPTITSPALSGTQTGTLVLGGTNTYNATSALIVLSATGSATTGRIGVSGTNVDYYNGTVWKQLDN